MKKILISWTTSWIWQYLANNLSKENEIISINKSFTKNENIKEIICDLNDIWNIKNALKNIENIDYLILNAWVWYFDKFENIDFENYLKTININLTANIALVYELLWKINYWIIFIWSLSWKKSQKFWAVYSASKFGLRWFAMNLKNELSWIKIQIINPKIVNTNFHKNSKIEIQWKFKETSLEEILNCITEILEKKEQRFEIDL